MLQQTTVATVTPRFDRFVERWPTVGALAAAEESAVLAEWAGLGYYARARNLVACARAVTERGGFPDTEAQLRDLPGIGAYTAAAIAAIAFGRTTLAIDTNVERVVARLFALSDRSQVRAAAERILPDGSAGDFIQALMDLGAAICRPRAPLCRQCPLNADCAAAALGQPEAFPEPKVRKVRPLRYGFAWWIERDGAVWLTRRPERGMLGGMAALPGPEWIDEAVALNGPTLASVRHIFTHFALDLAIVGRDSRPDSDSSGWWQPLAAIDQAGLPTLYARAVAAVLETRDAALEVGLTPP
jgi:A/G-specific adenine glycosylase